MLRDTKNLKDMSKDSFKDTERKSLISYGVNASSQTEEAAPLISLWRDSSSFFNKTNKLITALYMVTDMMENEEPLRLKLRTLGVEILSDISSSQRGTFTNLNEKISTILSFLNIVSDLGMISEMNSSILKKEFSNLKEAIQELIKQNHIWFGEFVKENPVLDKKNIENENYKNYKGHSTRIGVQKGSTLMHALGQIGNGHTRIVTKSITGEKSFETLKNNRRAEIISIIKDKKNTNGIGSVTITDIKNSAKGTLISCGEKTLQRELVSMVSDNVLKKTGSKRWSQYSLN